MGLDVYAYKYENRAKTKKLEEKYEDESNKIWAEYPAKYEEMTQAQKDEASKRSAEVSKKLGLDKYGSAKGTKIEINSKKYPEHMFKIGYLRSSYNDGGFNHVMRDFIGMDLYSIFEPGDEYEIQPDWAAALGRATEMMHKFHSKEKEGTFQVMESSTFHNSTEVVNSETALAKFMEEFNRYNERKAKGDKPFESYSCLAGHFFMEKPMEVVGVIRGKERFGPNQTDYLVYKSDLTWYKQALEITIEMIKYFRKSKAKDKIYLHWSS